MTGRRAGFLFTVLLVLATCASGCAAIVNGTTDYVTLRTVPPGGSIVIQGQTISDGTSFTIQKHGPLPKALTEGPDGRPHLVPLQFDPDPWIIADALWLFAGVVPGVVALGIDFGTGCWRDYRDIQIIDISGTGPRGSP